MCATPLALVRISNLIENKSFSGNNTFYKQPNKNNKSMKKITFLLSLLLASAGVTASAQNAFEVSSAPSNGSWASGTKWYKMSLREKYLSAYDADVNGNVRATATEAPTGAGAYWCIVADGENGYKLYNRAAGPNKVLGLSQTTTSDGFDGTRANFYAATTASSATEVGTTFDISLMQGQTVIYKVKLKDSQNLYWNQRAGYLGYWNNGGAATDDGSKVKFFAVDEATVEADDNTNADAYKTALSEKITAAQLFVADDKVGYYSQSAITAAQTVLNNSSSKAGDYYFAALDLQPNMPKAGVLYCIKSANTSFTEAKAIYHEGTTTKWGKYDVTNAAQYWFFTPWGRGYKLQTVDTKTYFNSTRSMSKTAGFVEIAWYAPNVVNIRVQGAQTLHAEGHSGGSGVSGNIIDYQETGFGKEAGPSSWTIVEATLDEAKQMQVKGTPEKYEGGLLVGTFDAQKAKAFNNKVSSSATMADVLNLVNTDLPAVVTVDANKFYRLVCVSPKIDHKISDDNNPKGDPTYTTLTRGTNNVVTAPFSKGNVDQIWKFEKTDGGYYLKNMNGNGYLNNVRQGDARASLVNTPSDKFEIMDGSVSTQKALHVVGVMSTACLFAENHPNEPAKGDAYAVAGWFQGSDYSTGGAWAWKFVEADDIEVALNTVESKSYATAYLPFGVSAVSGAKAYTAAEPANGQTVMTETANFAKETGVLLVSDEAADKAVLTIGDVEGATNTSALKGTLLAKDITGAQAKYLVFGKNKANETEVGFFEPSTTVTSIPANRAFFADAEGSAIALNFGNVTAVNNVVAGNANANAPIFDLSGRRVVKAVKGGLYIQNGKKYIVK